MCTVFREFPSLSLSLCWGFSPPPLWPLWPLPPPPLWPDVATSNSTSRRGRWNLRGSHSEFDLSPLFYHQSCRVGCQCSFPVGNEGGGREGGGRETVEYCRVSNGCQLQVFFPSKYMHGGFHHSRFMYREMNWTSKVPQMHITHHGHVSGHKRHWEGGRVITRTDVCLWIMNVKATFIGPKTYGICVVFISLFSLSLSLSPSCQCWRLWCIWSVETSTSSWWVCLLTGVQWNPL